jgi:hypothetical protein
MISGACTKVEPITGTFTDQFERAEIGTNYHNTGAQYSIAAGKLRVKAAYNHPLWLKKKLPRDAVIEFDVTSDSTSGDIKVEAWGDGTTHATHKGAYLASGYVFVFGGWGNQISALCRLDEHGRDRKERRDVKVKRGKTYHMKITRKGQLVSWEIDGKPFLKMNDTAPLEGEAHSYFGFNNWESKLAFDNLKITAIK